MVQTLEAGAEIRTEMVSLRGIRWVGLMRRLYGIEQFLVQAADVGLFMDMVRPVLPSRTVTIVQVARAPEHQILPRLHDMLLVGSRPSH